jgi:hypothetical protein
MELLHYRGIWPVLDESRPLRDLIAEAETDLPWLLATSRVERSLWGRPRWSKRPGRDVAGSGGAAEVLVVDLSVVPVRREVERTPAADAAALGLAA